ncbi:MAG: hypothetical protein J0I47_10520 [Sphingomonas sp.]|uniref:hypothetical protein n=1 Tax=Sphingomonas sp. TaxID=28214 RepID=UPI001ACB5CA5|nr:hypothetical protein [Sphingomonas sp.]MBN8808648.1 hypothetical protein [Sphingomonas sp.]
MNRPATHHVDPDAPDHAPETMPGANISTEHQEEGDAKRPSDTLDRDKVPPKDDGGRKSSFLHNY